MEFVFFGTASATPTTFTGHTSFLLTAAKPNGSCTYILTDVVDSPIRSMLRLGVDPLELDVVVLTHFHADHISAFPALLSSYNCMSRTKALVVVTNEETAQRVRGVLDLLDLNPDDLSFPMRYSHEYKDAHVDVRLLPAMHTVTSSMVRFETSYGVVFYTGDTRYDESIAEMAVQCDVLIHEATTTDEKVALLPGHSSAAQAGRTASAAGAKQLFLCHISYADYNGTSAIIAEAAQEFSGPVVIPKDMAKYSTNRSTRTGAGYSL